MVDTVSKDRRSEIMRSVRRENTAPELSVRAVAHSLGYRYRLHLNTLQGRPDIVFQKRRKVIFVHGCFWHGHANCRLARIPKSNSAYWNEKVARNRERDLKVIAALAAQDWESMVIWECETKDKNLLAKRLGEFLGPPKFSSTTGETVNHPIRQK
jgi:DNA mismatch endonuclease (patch repair protein)